MGNLTNFIHPSARVGAKNTKEGLGLGAGDRPDSFQSFIIKSKLTSFFGRRGSKPRIVRQMQTNPKIPEKSKVHKNSWVRNRQKMRWALTSSRWTQSERGEQNKDSKCEVGYTRSSPCRKFFTLFPKASWSSVMQFNISTSTLPSKDSASCELQSGYADTAQLIIISSGLKKNVGTVAAKLNPSIINT